MIDSLIDKLSDKGICINDPELMEEYGLSELSLRLSRNYLTVSRIAARERGKGAGTRFMNDLADLADRQGWTLTLTPDKSMGATSVGRLQRFYRRFGFRPNKGRNTDFNVRDVMIRVPRTDEAFRAGNRARKKESAADVADQVSASSYMTSVISLMRQKGYTVKKVDVFGDGRMCSWDDSDDIRGYKLPDPDAVPEPQGWLFYWCETVSDPEKVENYMMVFDDDITQWQGILWPINGDPYGAFWILDVDDMGFVHYNWEMYLHELDDDTVMSNGMTIGQYRRGILKDICGIEWPVSEAFRAGNRARKKESAQDTTEAVSLGCRNAEDVLRFFKDITDKYPDDTELLDYSLFDDKSITLGVYSPTVEYNGQNERITFEFDCDTPNNVSVNGGWARLWISTESYDESLNTSWDYFCDYLERNEEPNAYRDMFSEINLETHMVDRGYPTMLLDPENTAKFRECIDRAFGNVNEAFRAGSQARKKDSAFDFDSPFHTDGKSAAETLTAMIKKMIEDDKWVVVENPQDTFKTRHLAGVVYIENTFVRGVRGYESGHMPKDMNFIDIFRLMPEGSKKSAEGRGNMKQFVQEWSLRLYVLGDKVWVRMLKFALSGREHYTVRYNFQYEYPEWFTDETTLKNTFEGEIITRDPTWQDFTEFSDRVWLVNTDRLSDFARMLKETFADRRARGRQRLSPKAYAKWNDSPSIVDQLLESRDLSDPYEPSVRGKRNSQDQETPEPGEISDEVSYLTDCPFVIPKESIMFFKLMQDAVEAHTITSPDEFITKARPNGLK